MQTNFTLAQLADPDVAESEKILRTCVHCGFCTATCPTYVLLGDELDSPRGRIYLIKEMLEQDRPATAQTVKHIDRCLSCLSCMTTCPSGVHYMHLVDHARTRIEETYVRPWPERMLRGLLAEVLPHPGRFRLALLGAQIGRLFAALLPGRLRTLLDMAPKHLPSPSPVDKPQIFAAQGPRRARVALLNGCAQQVLSPEINEATIRLLTRHGVEVVVSEGAGCCGALVHHMGKEKPAHAAAKANIAAWDRTRRDGGLDAVIINASGCGTTVKDYGFMLREDADWADKATEISAMTKDISEFMVELGLREPRRATGQTIAYHAACSLQHGQKVRSQPKILLQAAGFAVREPFDAHLCCGSAGTYNLLQPELARQLRERKLETLMDTGAVAVASGNIGCLTQLAEEAGLPTVHTVSLLDWATGGPLPQALQDHPAFTADAPAIQAAAE
ncbi:glycolate oxidase subunit GlcF [Aquibaculum arenosum]|uniref:Glycolate oxidase iron-sulfur subunit n=1 Tax=Aquibaculum arenosum TaxID=3032591 RepID=A0ABT5YJ49_9PROT|nr:glycolate oxidase subunit GlcF [Fodinicurvata sp. CAU 1616]MDF2094966.1 glycolate oxidase subunit GlcF [Fodinicurvata sp. CAU 1616]